MARPRKIVDPVIQDESQPVEIESTPQMESAIDEPPKELVKTFSDNLTDEIKAAALSDNHAMAGHMELLKLKTDELTHCLRGLPSMPESIAGHIDQLKKLIS